MVMQKTQKMSHAAHAKTVWIKKKKNAYSWKMWQGNENVKLKKVERNTRTNVIEI